MLGSSLFSWRSSMAAAAASIARQTGTLAAARDPDSICTCRSLSRTSNSFISADGALSPPLCRPASTREMNGVSVCRPAFSRSEHWEFDPGFGRRPHSPKTGTPSPSLKR